ncbi:MAG: peptidylprolyl isomerase, partial [bacterium]
LKTKEEIKEFTRDAARMLNIEINESAFDYLSNKLLKHDDLLQETPDGIAHARSDEQAKSEALVVFDSKRWTVGDFFDRAEFTSLRQKKRIKDCEQLRLFIKGLVLRDKLIEQARAIGLHKHRSVQKEIAREIRSYTLKRMRDRIEQEMRNKVQVPVSAMRAHYTMFADQYFFLEEANVAEILVDSETLGKEIIARLGRGEAFADLARKYSLREWAKERGGELGFAPRSKFGALADTVFATPIGSVIGPLRIEQHYSVIKILAKKDRKSKNFTQAKEQVEQELGWKWQKEGMQNYLHNLRQEMIVETDEQKLRNVMVPGGTS